jgi:hypothetical protein
MAKCIEVACRQPSQVNGHSQVCGTLEFLHLVNPSNMNYIWHLARFYMLYGMDVSDLLATTIKMQDVSKKKYHTASSDH